MLPMVFNYDHSVLSQIADGKKEKGCVVVDCHKPGALICNEHLCELGLQALHHAQLWVLAYQYYKKGVSYKVFNNLVSFIRYYVPAEGIRSEADIKNLVELLKFHKPQISEALIRDIVNCFAGLGKQ